jgi:hypothetical protein
MTPEDKKAKMLAKLNETPKPVITQVVRVEEQKRPGRPEKVKTEPTEHFNVYLPESLAGDLRVHKARTRKSIQDIVTEAVQSYLDKAGALTNK